MSRKRRNTSSPEPDDLPPSPKRRNIPGAHLNYESEGESHETPRFDDRVGQTGAFPGLGADDDELFYGPASDGIDYLRMVRSEAKHVPHILTASGAYAHQEVGQEEGEIEEGGYYHDGTYAATHERSTAVEPASSLPPAQTRYYDALLRQFNLIRKTLRCSPPLSAVQTLRPDQFISFPENTNKVRTQWVDHILSTDPHPVQLACMDSSTVVELVSFLGMELERLLRVGDQIKVARVGAWVWAILGKCRDCGEMSSEEVGDLRQLAQVALRSKGDHQPVDIDIDDEDGNIGGTVPTAQTAEKNSAESTASHLDGQGLVMEKPDNSGMRREKLLSRTVDMIVTVVGEVYGQRDLLDARTIWLHEEVR
ncbi:hypothetical protein A1O7_06699 [Cladophialophora yegresii CBS 114405]|uniref:Uncharacterized protein n=1 Tax=Cladophialophora yegresii CBS 114405 TaxID=1182544 RepID=W9VU49_9EURO|nr:uncharacterized protein A1O7_06699 [Cladophialophora yegresii CBS 114405]EXJ59267.1 hypothetical protein A1O7_06699 [Cladophialophora yegresii CBS 114405]